MTIFLLLHLGVKTVSFACALGVFESSSFSFSFLIFFSLLNVFMFAVFCLVFCCFRVFALCQRSACTFVAVFV